MIPDNTDRTAKDSAALDRILAGEEELIPTSGFLATVMEQVQEEAALPPPIPFPWKRAVPGMMLAAGVLGWGAFELVRAGIPALRNAAPGPLHFPAGLVRPVEQAGWIALALGVSLVSWLLSRRLAGSGGLL
jgi:hypothetical protein